MPPPNQQTEPGEAFIHYLEFLSDMLGGDVFPLNRDQHDVRHLINERAIDYTLIQHITRTVINHNTVFQLFDRVEAYATLDALGSIRGDLLDNKGDVHQISLIDRIGELTVSFFNLSTQRPQSDQYADARGVARVYAINKHPVR